MLLLTSLAGCSTETAATRPPERPAAVSGAAVPAANGFDPSAYYGRSALFVKRGAASFYADSFAGRRTANGERYDPNAYTAAHRSLPFGSILRIVHEKSGAWVLVRVNDRGPYARGRIIDLSRQAARRLSILHEGVARVRLEVLELGHKR
jgi:rare lipoprotein A